MSCVALRSSLASLVPCCVPSKVGMLTPPSEWAMGRIWTVTLGNALSLQGVGAPLGVESGCVYLTAGRECVARTVLKAVL